MVKRKSTGKRLRFEIFKRDGFRCVYCGANPTQQALRVDHVEPVANGGKTVASNLVTACFDCNAGKSNIPLEQRQKVVDEKELRDRADQIFGYLRGVCALEDARSAVGQKAIDYWNQLKDETFLPVSHQSIIRRACIEFDLSHVFNAMQIAHAKYPGRFQTQQTISFRYFCGILRNWRREGTSI